MIRLSASAFDILWSDLGHDRPPAPLTVPSVGGTEDERARIRASVYDNLAGRGLRRDGELDPALRTRLHTLATARIRVECEAITDFDEPEPLRMVAAAGGRRAVLAAQPERTIALSSIRPAELFDSLIELVPGLWPGPGFGVSLPAAMLEGADDPVFAASGRSAAYEQQVREVLAIQARPVYGAGQFTVRVRDDAGRFHRTGGVTWFSTDVGAYLGSVAPGRGGQDWVSVAPADGARLAGRLAELAECG